MTPAEIERRVRSDGDISVLEQTHHHRTWREDALGRSRGRDRLRERRTEELAADGTGDITVEADGKDMIAYTTAAGWRGHRWLQHEGDRLIGEVEIIDGAARVAALGIELTSAAQVIGAATPMHAPLGELRAGRGQLETPDAPETGAAVPDKALDAARWLHQLWNARAIGLVAEQWRGPAEAGADGRGFMLSIFAALPDAVCFIERATILPDGRIALLWRLHGHHLGSGLGEPSGKRARLIGSSILTIEDRQIVREDMLIDTLALRATPHRPIIGYEV